LVGAAGFCTSLSKWSWAASPLDQFSAELSSLAEDGDAVDRMRGYREFQDIVALAPQSALPKVGKSDKPISDAANDLIVFCEVSSQAQYDKRYKKPTWPRGQSGATIGIGYDLGYVDGENLRADWQGRLSDDSIHILETACGITGIPAKQLVPSLSSVEIEWTVAKAQYNQEIRPRYVALTESELENCDQLTPSSLGALVSLVYNRGPSWSVAEAKDKKGHYTEMRNIRRLMVEQNFQQIPQEIRSMKRLWEGNADMKGLVVRRELEAKLFELGLSES